MQIPPKIRLGLLRSGTSLGTLILGANLLRRQTSSSSSASPLPPPPTFSLPSTFAAWTRRHSLASVRHSSSCHNLRARSWCRFPQATIYLPTLHPTDDRRTT